MIPRKHSEDFKTELCNLVLVNNRSINGVAKERNISPSLLRNWVGKARNEKKVNINKIEAAKNWIEKNKVETIEKIEPEKKLNAYDISHMEKEIISLERTILTLREDNKRLQDIISFIIDRERK